MYRYVDIGNNTNGSKMELRHTFKGVSRVFFVAENVH